MKTKINWREEFIKLFPEETERKLIDNHKWCPDCKGIGFKKNRGYIEFCSACDGMGQIELCKNKCGHEKAKYADFCEECQKKVAKTFEEKRKKKNYDKATKINFDDYQGKFLINETVYDKDEIEDIIWDSVLENEEPVKYLYGTYKEPVMSINFEDVIRDACEEGYEDMTDYLDYDGVEEMQILIDKWIKKQGENNYCYWEDNKTVVLLDNLIDKVKAKVKSERDGKQ